MLWQDYCLSKNKKTSSRAEGQTNSGASGGLGLTCISPKVPLLSLFRVWGGVINAFLVTYSSIQYVKDEDMGEMGG